MHRKSLILELLLAVYLTTPVKAAQTTKYFDISTSINFRFAETTVTSEVLNDGVESQEITFQSLLPKEAFISSFSMTIDGKTYEATIEEKEKARKTFEAARKLNKTAGLVETRKTSGKIFKTSVNVAAGETVLFKLVYVQLLRRIRGKYMHQVILLGSQLTEKLSVNTYICENQDIKIVNIPPLLTSNGTAINPDVTVIQEKNTVHVEYVGNQNVELQETFSEGGGSFVVEYELEGIGETGEIILDRGHFAYFFAPDVKILPRRVIFVLDVSGSMSGNRIRQLKIAMDNIIEKLTEQDRFGIVTFQSSIQIWNDTGRLKIATKENIQSAHSFIMMMNAGGGTNIHDALQTAIALMYEDSNETEEIDPTENYIVFLTDGMPTAGITSRRIILQRIDESNEMYPIHAIGIGLGVDAEFLKSLAARNNGTWTQIMSDINAALQIQSYLDELSVSFFKDVVVEYPESIVDELITLHQDPFPVGGELVTFGRLKDGIDPRNRGPHTVEISGGPTGEVASANIRLDQPLPTCGKLSGKSVSDFGTKAFGLQKVTEALRLLDAEMNETIKEELREQAINLSLHYNLVTTVTSLIVIKPEDQEAIEKLLQEAEKPTPPSASGAGLPAWRVSGDPHFMIQLSEEITACFNWKGNRGEIFNLLHDHDSGIVVNGLLDGPEIEANKGHSLYISKLVIILRQESIVITINPREANVHDTSPDKQEQDLHLDMVNTEIFDFTYGNVTFRISEVTRTHTIITITVVGDVSFIVNLHHSSDFLSEKFDHLDFMISGSGMLSPNITGIFGRFPRYHKSENPDARIVGSGDRTYLWLTKRNRPIKVKKTSMLVPHVHRRESCWLSVDPKIILGVPMRSFLLKNLMEM